jgi:hypothetical protein
VKPVVDAALSPVQSERPVRAKDEPVEFGNLNFPSFVDVYRTVGGKAERILDKETSEHVTSRFIFAQAFFLKEGMRLESISLALKKFGGDGTIYVDLVKDDRGKPGLSGLRSKPVFLESVDKRKGYHWVDFSFPGDTPLVLGEGRYWIVLRHSGEVIMNWFYTPGKVHSGPFDTRTTSKGHTWEDILNCDFVFKIRGMKSGGDT